MPLSGEDPFSMTEGRVVKDGLCDEESTPNKIK